MYVWEGRDLLQPSEGENGREFHFSIRLEPRSVHTPSRFLKSSNNAV